MFNGLLDYLSLPNCYFQHPKQCKWYINTRKLRLCASMAAAVCSHTPSDEHVEDCDMLAVDMPAVFK